ncbi:MAG: uracil-DNA glycosylase family 4 [Planctomycetota bacterium]
MLHGESATGGLQGQLMAENGDSMRNLERHLEHWLLAYGSDLAIPAGTVLPRTCSDPSKAVPLAAEEAVAEYHAEATPEPPAPAAASAAKTRPVKQVQELPETTQSPTVTALRALRAEVLACTKCKLHSGRQNAVFGEGNPTARVMFIGEAPGAREDESGRPFVGPAGQLLERILEAAMGLQRSEAFVTNLNKCRAPGNRAPEADEVAACLPYLKQQVKLVQPEVLVCLGRTAAQNLLGSTESLASMRGQDHSYNGVPVIVTWHPAYLLREPSKKRETWDDIKRVNKLLGRPEVPPPKR